MLMVKTEARLVATTSLLTCSTEIVNLAHINSQVSIATKSKEQKVQSCYSTINGGKVCGCKMQIIRLYKYI